MDQRILLFQDGAKLQSPIEKWRYINVLTHALIQLIREPGFEYAIVDPVVCAKKLQDQIRPDEFSCIIDLSGLFGKTLQLEGVTTIDEFHLSRLRKVSSPLFDGVGFLVNIPSYRIEAIKERIQAIKEKDERPFLVLDDVGWSGRTVRQAVTMLGISPDNATLGFLVGNKGVFGQAKTEIEKLEEAGFRVLMGEEVVTPRDDGFHLADFSLNNDSVFDIFLEIQALRERLPSSFDDNGKKRKEILKTIQEILESEQKKLFPKGMSTEAVIRLSQEGKIVTLGGIGSNAFFDVNPTNWLMPSFSQRVSSQTLRENKRDIIDVTSELHDALTIQTEGKETQREIIGRGKERL